LVKLKNKQQMENKGCIRRPTPEELLLVGYLAQKLNMHSKLICNKVYGQSLSWKRGWADFNKLNVIDISPSSVSNPRAFHKSLINNVKISRVLDPWTKTKDPVFHIEIPQ
jgi:NHL/RHS/YD repeat protein